MRLILPLLFLATPALALDCAEGQRLLSHPMLQGGSQCLPDSPGRIALVDETAITAWMLGVRSITGNTYLEAFFESYPGAVTAEARAGLLDLGPLLDLVDVESIAAAAPDLIVSGNFWTDLNQRLAQIAPTAVVAHDETQFGWKDAQGLVAALLGAEARNADVMAGHDARLAALAGALPDGQSFAVVRAMDTADTIQVFTALNFGTQQLLAAGMELHADVLTPDAAGLIGRPHWYGLSVERIDDLDADWLVVLPGWDPAVEQALHASPYWQALPAVAEGRLIRPQGNGEHYIRDNAAFAHLVFDDLWRDVLGQDPAAVSPNPFAAWLATE